MMNCPKCTHVLRAEARFCDSCGAPVSSPDVRAAAGGAAQTLRDDPLIGQTLDGKYEIAELLGEGGMGAVYRARRLHIGDEAAVKVLPRRFVADAASVERFRREARAAAMLRHTNVVTIYDYGEAASDDAPAYIVMELLEGMSLRHLLRSAGRLAAPRAVALMREICAGVGAAHRRGVFHRDLKPDNVIVLPPDEDREREAVKVVDFGIAKLRDAAGAPTLTQTGTLVGTPYYMSPEQCRGETLDARSDVYSLGAMLYEMLAGSPPFTAETITGVIAKHLFDAPPPFAPELGATPHIEAVVMHALAKVSAERPPDASTFARDLQDAMHRKRDEEEGARAAEERRRAEEQARLRAEAEARRAAEEEAHRVAELERRSAEEKRRGRGAAERREREEAAAALAAEEERRREAEAELALLLRQSRQVEMVLIPGGAFLMGSPGSEEGRNDDEGPQRRVKVPNFYLGKYQVTQAQWMAVMGDNPSHFGGDNLPVEGVSWDAAEEFCRRLSRATRRRYRLPSEAEWEYACRAGTQTPFAFGPHLSSDMANFDGNHPYGDAPKGEYRQRTTPVGSFPPNAFGLYDMHGNVWEWCQDIYHPSYSGAPTDGSACLSGGASFRVLRGGAWTNFAVNLRSAIRLKNLSSYRYNTFGFRVAMDAPR